MKIWEKLLPGRRHSNFGRGYSKCKGPAVGMSLACFRNQIEVAGSEGQMVRVRLVRGTSPGIWVIL